MINQAKAPTREEIKHLKEEYPIGTRVELVFMDDVQAPKIGTRGFVNSIDDIGSVHISWDNGSGLAVCFGVDKIKKVRTCPKCHKEYTDVPAISRLDNKTELCPHCGNRQSMELIGMPEDKINGIMEKIENIEKENK